MYLTTTAITGCKTFPLLITWYVKKVNTHSRALIVHKKFQASIIQKKNCWVFFQADGKMKKALPLLIYGVVTICVAFLSILLPETKKRKLLEQVEDVEHEEDLMVDRYVLLHGLQRRHTKLIV